MTIITTNSTITYTGSGTTGPFTFTSKIFEAADLVVTKTVIATGVETVLELTTDYTVSLDETAPSAGTLTTTDAVETTETITINNVQDLTQENNFPANDPFPSSTVENSLDKLTMICQQLQDQINRSLLRSVTSVTPLNFPALENGLYLTNDGSDLAWSNLTNIADYTGSIDKGNDADKSASPSAGDIYIATDTEILYICYTIGTWNAANYTGSIDKGNDADKSATPTAGDLYIALDTSKYYACYSTGVWTEVGATTAQEGSFTNASLSGSNLSITNTTGISYPNIAIYDNNGKNVLPDDITISGTTIVVNFTSFVPLAGTWNHSVG